MDRGISWRCLASVLCALCVLASPERARGEGVTVIQHDGSAYAQSAAARQRVAKAFFEANPDSYDFLVVFPAFATSLGAPGSSEEALGLCSTVRSEVTGIGMVGTDQGEAYGSRSRLKAFIDVASLVPGTADATPEGALGILAHEVAHLWSGRVSFRDRQTGAIRRDLLGRDSAHWSFFLDSQASVLYGSEWREVSPGNFVSTTSRKRYSALDLYLMGFLTAAEVPALTLLNSGQSSWDATDIPPADGTRIAASAEVVSIEDVIAAEGPRLPAATEAQRQFRAAFILLTPPGIQPTAAQLEFVDRVRRAWSSEFFFLTHGRAIMETELVNGPSGPFAADPNIQKGFDYLFSRQESDGSWSDQNESGVRDTQAALNAIRLVPSDPRLNPARLRAASYLEALAPVDADSKARQLLGLVAANRVGIAIDWATPIGLAPGWERSVIDTVLAANARAVFGSSAEESLSLNQWILQQQNLDGGWPYFSGGPSRIEPTALALSLISSLSAEASLDSTRRRAGEFLRTRRLPQGLFGDDDPTVSATAMALKALYATGMLESSDAVATAATILSAQLEDGSWSQSAHETALALEALRLLKTSNLALEPGSVALSRNRVVDGEMVLVSLRVRNEGFVASEPTTIGAFDAQGHPMGAAVAVQSVEPGRYVDVQVVVDTTGHGPGSELHLVLDPASSLDETRRDDNFLTVPLVIDQPPAQADLVVAYGSVHSVPAALDHLPHEIIVTVQVNNLGLAEVDSTSVSLYAGGLLIGTKTVALPARSSAAASISGTIAAVEGASVPLTVTVDAENSVAEGDETNNTATGAVEVLPAVNLIIQALAASTMVEQGDLVPVTFEIANRGTVETAGAEVEVRLLKADGSFIATLASWPVSVFGGEVLQQAFEWRAGFAGDLRIQARVINSDESFPDDNSASVPLSVAPSSSPNLVVRAADFIVEPSPALEGREATLRATVTNSSSVSAGEFSVAIYDGDPLQGGVLLSRQTIGNLGADATAPLSSLSLGVLGGEPKTFVLVLDLENAVQEFDEEDNRTIRTIKPVSLPDAVLLAQDVVLGERSPRENTDVSVGVSVRNAGMQTLSSTRVELFLGIPESGGVLVGAQELAPLDGGQSAQAQFVWPTGNASGKQILVAVVNREAVAEERRLDNNRGQVEVFVQDGAFAASPKYLSPNGDGVKDSVELFYRLESAAAVEVRLSDTEGRSVRTLEAAAAPNGMVEWDGRDHVGQLVADGEYTAVLSAAGGIPIHATTEVVVDTNRSPLHAAAGGSLLRRKQLDASLQIVNHGNRSVHAMPDDSGVLFFSGRSSSGEEVPFGLYLQPIGGTPHLVSPAIDAFQGYGFALSPDGDRVAFFDLEGNASRLRLLSLRNQTIETIASDEPSGVIFVQGAVDPLFSPDGSRILVMTRGYGDRLELFSLDGFARTLVAAEQEFSIRESRFSPDGSRISVLLNDGTLYTASTDGGERTVLLPEGMVPYRAHHEWTPDGGSILVTQEFAGGVILVDALTGFHQPFLPGSFSQLEMAKQGSSLALTYAYMQLYDKGARRVDSPKGRKGVALSAPLGTDPVDVDSDEVLRLEWSGQGRFLVMGDGWQGGGVSNWRALYSLLNLSVDLMAARRSGENAITFRGTVADAHLDRFEIRARRIGGDQEWLVQKSNAPIVEGVLAQWIPPEPGVYEAELAAWDLAGNSRRIQTKFAWSDRPAVAALALEPGFISPNGDGIQDATTIRYIATQAVSVDFAFRNASGTAVRTVSRTHLQAGDYSLSWDGTDDDGFRVPDGVYRMEVEGTSREIVVDTVPPENALGFAQPLPSAETEIKSLLERASIVPCQASFEASDACRSQANHHGFLLAWQAKDERLVEWRLEASERYSGPTGYQPIETGVGDDFLTRVEPTLQHGRHYRLVSFDKAGNRSATEGLLPKESAFVSHVAEGQWMTSGGVLHASSGVVLPRVDKAFAVLDAQGRPRSVPTKGAEREGNPGMMPPLGFWIEHTISRPVVGVELAYRLGGAVEFTGGSAQLLGDGLVFWNADGIPWTSCEVELRLVDDAGRRFSSRVSLSGPEGPSDAHCFSVARRAIRLGGLLDPGGVVELSRCSGACSFGGTVEAVVPLIDGVARLPSLAGCTYRMRQVGELQGKPYSADRGVVELCGMALSDMRVNAGMLDIPFDASFIQPIVAVDVYLGGQRRGRFSVLPEQHSLQLPLLPSDECRSLDVRLVAHLADGAVFDTNRPPQGWQPCETPPLITAPCSQLLVGRPVRDETAPSCSANDPDFWAEVRYVGPQKPVAIEAAVRSMMGSPEFPASVDAFVQGDTTVLVDGSTLAEGKYLVVAKVSFEGGERLEATSDSSFPLIIDRTPPVVSLSAPAGSAQVCTVVTTRPDGRVDERIEIRGLIADENLEMVSVLVRAEGEVQRPHVLFGPLPAPRRMLLDGRIGTIDAAGLPAGRYEIVLNARDASGGSTCTIGESFQLSRAVSVASLKVVPSLFAPDLGLPASIKFDSDDTAQAVVSLLAGEEPVGEIQSLSVAAGMSEFEWDGSLSGGGVPLDGSYVVRVSAANVCGAGAADAFAWVEIDTEPPVARIDEPATGSSTGVLLSVRGEATDRHFLEYELSVGTGLAPTAFVPVHASSGPAVGVLGTVDTSTLDPGEYVLRLRARDTLGHESEDLVGFVVPAKWLIDAFAVTPALVSPDGDGLSDASRVRARVLAACNVSVALVDGARQVIKVLQAATPVSAGEVSLDLDAARLAGVPDGEWIVRMTANCGGSEPEVVDAPLVIDTEAPVVEVLEPASGAAVAGMLSVEGEVGDPQLEGWTLVLAGPGIISTLSSDVSSRSGVLGPVSTLQDGSYELGLKASDRAGHRAEKRVAFISDSTPPMVAFIHPLAGAFVSGAGRAVQVRASLTEANLKELRLEAEVPGGSRRLLSSTSGLADGGLVTEWDAASEADGPLVLHLTAVDAAGNTASASIDVRVDNTPPVAAIASPQGWMTGAEQILGTASDENLRTWLLTWARKGEAGSAGAAKIGSGSASVVDGRLGALVSVPQDGSYTLQLSVEDAAGNLATAEQQLIVDLLPPAAPLLAGVLSGPKAVQLSWSCGVEEDLAGYQVFRALGHGQLVLQSIVAAPACETEDEGLADGDYRYAVIAIDLTGNESDLSNALEFRVDTTPPAVSISRPASEGFVSGTVSVVGTAFSRDDFKEMRLSVGEGSSPAEFALVARSAVPALNSVLGEIDLHAVADGSVRTVKLEAEDLNGNHGEARVFLRVDNTPPSAPVLLSATPSTNSIGVAWAPSSDPDLRGYLLFRNGVLANGPLGASFESWDPFILAASDTIYVDAGLPDGTFEYVLRAIDHAGNLSEASNVLSASLDNRAPVAVVRSPRSLERVVAPVTLLAETEDEDVAQVQFEVRSTAGGVFVALGAPRDSFPYVANFDPSNFASSVVEVRAVATDKAGQVDPAPASVFYLVDPPLSALAVSATVDGNAVALAWSGAEPHGRVVGYGILRDGASVLSNPVRPGGTASANTTSQGTPANGYDEKPWTRWVSEAGMPQSWQLALNAPAMLSSVIIESRVGVEAELDVEVEGFWLPVVARSSADYRGMLSFALPYPVRCGAVRVRFVASSTNYASISEASLGQQAVLPGTSFSESGLEVGEHRYGVTAFTSVGPSSTGEASALVYSPFLDAPAAMAASPSTQLFGRNTPAGARVSILAQGAIVATTTSDGEGAFRADVPLVVGENELSAQAVDENGNRSLPSESVRVVHAPAPDVGLALALDSVVGSSVSLSFAVVGDTSDVAGFILRRAFQGSSVERPVAADARAVAEERVANGRWSYQLAAFNSAGFHGEWSNAVEATVDVATLPAPQNLAVQAPAPGSQLDLTWDFEPASPIGGFIVERSNEAQAGFATAGPLVEERRLSDRTVSNGTAYYYRVAAVDVAGNRGEYSPVATGIPRDARAPVAPRIMQPTVAGTPVTLRANSVTVSGFAEHGTTVSLYANGALEGMTRVGDYVASVEPISTVYPLQDGSFALSSDASLIAYSYTPPSGTSSCLAVEGDSLSAPASFCVAGALVSGRISVSPDRKMVAFEGFSLSTYRSYLHVADLQAGTAGRLTALTEEERFPTWSPDSSRLAYVASRQYASVLAIHSPLGGDEQILAQVDGCDLASPVWMGKTSIAVVANCYGAPSKLVKVDSTTGHMSELAASQSFESSLAISADGKLLAAIALEDGGSRLVLVDTTSGTLAFPVSDSSVRSSPVFSPEATQLAVLADGQLELHELAAGTFTKLTAVAATRLVWTSTGLVGIGYSDASRLSWDGSFSFSRVRLSAGENYFTAVAEDDSGNRSAPADPVLAISDPSGLADLAVAAIVQPVMPLVGEAADAIVTVHNLGAVAADNPDLVVSVFGSDGSVRSAPLYSLGAIGPGQSVSAAVPLDLLGLEGIQRLSAVVDPAGLVPEADRSNNEMLVSFRTVADLDPVFLSLSVGPESVGAAGSFGATATLVNPGPAVSASVTISLESMDGTAVVTATPEFFAPLPFLSERAVARELAVGNALAGSYQVVARATVGGQVVSEAMAPVVILPNHMVALSVRPQQAEFAAGAPIGVELHVENGSPNVLLRGAHCELRLQNAQGEVLLSRSVALPPLARGASFFEAVTFEPGLPPGQYRVLAEALLDGAVLANATTEVEVAGSVLLAGELRLTGALGNPPRVRKGSPLSVEVIVANAGAMSTEQVAARLSVIDPQNATVETSVVLAIGSLAAGASWASSPSVPTDSLTSQLHGLVLTASYQGGAEQILATGRLELVEGSTPVLSVVDLTDGMFVPAAIAPTVAAADGEEGVQSVRVKVDSGVPRSFTLVSGSPLDGLWTGGVELVPDGVHRLEFSALDRAGNDGASFPEATNPVSLSVIVDSVPPAVSILGIQNGAVIASEAVATIQATDEHLDASHALLDDAPYRSGEPIRGNGKHVLLATARDLAGNEAFDRVEFEIDYGAPRITIAGISDGAYVNGVVTPTVQIFDPNLQGQSVRLDGTEFLPGSSVSAEGQHTLAAEAWDAGGNRASAQVRFVIDMTAPQVLLEGFVEGALLASTVTPKFSATDLNLAGVAGALDEMHFLTGEEVSLDGSHTLVVTAYDKAGNSASAEGHFAIDRTAPAITFGGFVGGAHYREDVLPTFEVMEPHPAGAPVAKLDGSAFVPGSAVCAEGEHQLVVEATDLLGNHASVLSSFTIDKTPPQIAISGVVDDGFYLEEVRPAFTTTDAYLESVTATLDGEPFETGAPIDSVGTHILIVKARDQAGNVATQRVEFTLSSDGPGIVHVPIAAAQPEGVPVAIDARTTEDVVAVRLFHRVRGASTFASVSMSSSMGDLSWTASIPAAEVVSPGVEYYLEASGGEGRKTTHPEGAPGTVHDFSVLESDRDPPVITHEPVADGRVAAQPVEIRAAVADPSGVSTVAVFYRLQGAPEFTRLPLVLAAEGEYSAQIPASDVRSPGLEYYLEAVDASESANTRVEPLGAPADLHVFTVSADDDAPPMIDHTPIGDGQPEGLPVVVNALVTDASGVASVSLFVRLAGSSAFEELPMTEIEANAWSAEIPALLVGLPGVEYYMLAIDASPAANARTSPEEGAAAPHAFSVVAKDSAGPSITHHPVEGPAPFGEAISISALISDPSGIAAARLHVRPADGSWQEIPLARGAGDSFAAEIPTYAVTSPSVSYFLEASDAAPAGNQSTLPSAGSVGPFVVAVNPADEEGPTIAHEPVAQAQPSGEEVVVVASVSDDSGVGEVRVYFRHKGEDAFRSASLSSSDGLVYEGSIPADAVRVPGVDYYLEASDLASHENRSRNPVGAPGSVHTFAVDKPTGEVAPQSCGCSAAEGTLFSVVAAFACASALMPHRRRRWVDRAQ